MRRTFLRLLAAGALAAAASGAAAQAPKKALPALAPQSPLQALQACLALTAGPDALADDRLGQLQAAIARLSQQICEQDVDIELLQAEVRDLSVSVATLPR